MPYAKNKIRVNVPKFSGFDKSHRNTGTLTCGTLTPILCDELIPNSKVSLKLNLASQLPPLASDTYMNLKLKAEAFFVPMRLLCASFEDFFCDDAPKSLMYTSSLVTDVFPRVPYFDKSSDFSYLGIGTPGYLPDYLGIRDAQVGGYSDINMLPFIAYHLVWQEWYRNPRVQQPCFVKPLDFTSNNMRFKLKCTPYCYFGTTATGAANAQAILSPAYVVNAAADTELADGVSIVSLRQRNFGQDYFTGARVSPQQGPAVTMDLNVTGQVAGGVITAASTHFTIAALRAANSLQQFRERNNIPSPRLVDQVSARYGAKLSDGIAQRPICIGSATYDVNSSGVSQTAESSAATSANPFNTVSAQYGRAFAAGSDFIIDNFVANEPGYLLVNISLVPEATYSSGLDRMFTRYTAPGSITDMACSLLQNVGDQPIYQRELSSNSGQYQPHVFGYTDRFADFMFKPNSVHGMMRAGQSLAAFVAQRNIITGGSPLEINSSFLEIPKNYLDQVFAVSSAVSGVSAWYDCMLDYKVSMPLAEYSLPSLQDPAYEHGQTITLRRNGQIF